MERRRCTARMYELEEERKNETYLNFRHFNSREKEQGLLTRFTQILQTFLANINLFQQYNSQVVAVPEEEIP